MFERNIIETILQGFSVQVSFYGIRFIKNKYDFAKKCIFMYKN